MAVISDDRPMPGADLEAMFRPQPPPTGPLMDDATNQSSATSPTTASPSPASPYATPSPRPGTPADTLTRTSGTGSPRGDARAAGKAILAIVGALVLVVDAVLVRAAQRRLRRPTRAQMSALATPAGRLAYRHGVAAVLGEDVGDVVEMTGAVADYLLDGPVTYSGPQVEYADDDPWNDDEPAPAAADAFAPYVTMPAPPTPAAAPPGRPDAPHVTFLT